MTHNKVKGFQMQITTQAINTKDKLEMGRQGENLGKEYLKNKGYILLARNFSCKKGEIDLIFLDKKTIVAVEVKTRTSFTFGLAREAITQKKKNHLIGSLQCFLKAKQYKNENIRIDIVEVYLGSLGQVNGINHIENAVYKND